MASIHFHATNSDLLRLIDLIETSGSLKYTRTGNFLRRELGDVNMALSSGRDILTLGFTTATQSAGCANYLVCDTNTIVTPDEFVDNYGNERVCIDQRYNPDSVGFRPGGMYSDSIHLEGTVGTVSDTPVAKALMKRFVSAIKKTFTKNKWHGVYVGPEAMRLLETGCRFTQGVQSPREFDLKLDSER